MQPDYVYSSLIRLYNGYRFTHFLAFSFSCLGKERLLGLVIINARPDLSYLRVSYSIRAMARRSLSWPAPSSSLDDTSEESTWTWASCKRFFLFSRSLSSFNSLALVAVRGNWVESFVKNLTIGAGLLLSVLAYASLSRRFCARRAFLLFLSAAINS